MFPMPGVKLTYDDLLRLPDDSLRHELIDGEHFVTPSPNTRHQRIVGQLHGILWNWLEQNPLGEIYIAPTDVVLGPSDVVVPDLLYLSLARAAEVLTPEAVRGMPDLIVEVLSPSTRRRDETLKRSLYARSGVAEYWIVDPARQAIVVHRPASNATAIPLTLTAAQGEVLTTSLFPGLEIPLVRIFAG